MTALDDPELQARLAELDHELEEGDITEKGYQKRRALLLAQYGYPPSGSIAGSSIRDSTAFSASPRSSLSAARQSVFVPRSDTTTPSSGAGGGGGDSQFQPPPLPREEEMGAGYYGGKSPLPLHVRNDSRSSLPQRSREPSISSSLNAPASTTGAQQNLTTPAPLYIPYKPPRFPQQQQYIPPVQEGYVEDYGGQRQISNDYGDPHRRQGSMDTTGMYDPSGGMYFSDFTEGQQQPMDQQQVGYADGGYGTTGPAPQVRQRYPSGEGPGLFSPAAATGPPMLSANDLPQGMIHQMPLEPRDVSFAIYDPHNGNVPMSKFDNIATVLRHRARTNGKNQAYLVLDAKGKEAATCSWEKLASRAEKVAQVIRDKSNLYRGDRVALIYRDIEIIDFAVALMGCFIAGVVAVPINNAEDYNKLNFILTTTQAHLALTTDHNLKAFQRDISANKLSWPRNVEWWKTNEFGGYTPKRKDEAIPPLQISDLAYIEFSRAPTGDLKGVVMSHRTIMHQMACLSAIIATAETKENKDDTFPSALKDKLGKPTSSGGEVLVSYLDPRQQIGLIIGVLLGVYGGQTTVWCSSQTVQTPGLYAHILSRYKATLCLADYPGLKLCAYNYQQDPYATRNFQRKQPPNISAVKLCMIDALTVDSEFHEILADRWFRPLGNTKTYREVVAPMLCLAEHGGMVICVRDWLGGEDRLGIITPEETAEEKSGDNPDDKSDKKKSKGIYGNMVSVSEDKSSGLAEILLDREALKTNDVVVVAAGDEARKRAGEAGTIRVGAFGYPIPDATLAVVDPENSVLCAPNVIGEIWVDSPSLSGGFWALTKEAETIFHARAYMFEEGNPHPVPIEPEFLRTGLLGFILEGKVFVLGLYEDRIRQRVEWVEEEQEGNAEYRYFFVQHLIVTIMRNLAKVYDCSAFDVLVNDEYLPIVVIESPAASTSPINPGGPPRQLNTALLESLSEKCMEVLLEEHHLRVYCVMITAPNTLPRVIKNGRREIGNMLCRREFDRGTLPCVHVKFGVERAVLNLPIGIDPVGGIWSQVASNSRSEVLLDQEKQYSGIDFREVISDDRTSTPLNHFTSIVDLMQWRVARQSEELAYTTIDARGKEGKSVSWKKLDQKIAAVAAQMKNKWKLKAGDHVILMYTHSEEFVFAVHACFCLGIVAMPVAPLDQNRLSEDVPALLHMIQDYNVRSILVNNDVDHLIKAKNIVSHIKQSAQYLKVSVPPTHNTQKPPKQNNGCRDLGFVMKQDWVKNDYTALVWTYWTPDQRRVAVALGHDTIMGICKVQKETCQMSSSRPVLGCVRSYSGIGFLHTVLMGIFIGASTYLITPVDYATSPITLFLALSRYKVKDTYATTQMLEHAMQSMPGKGFTLHELRNMMIASEGRPRVEIYQKVRAHFSQVGLDRTAINTIYSHVLNPMIASRSYMDSEPIELFLDTKALRRGFIYPVHPDEHPAALLVQDSGMVAVNTSIAIVNPETCKLCHAGEFGEIWVESEACVKSFYGSRDKFDLSRFNGHTLDGDRSVRYIRTGDLGFLHRLARPMGLGGAMLDCWFLFVLGSIGETFEVNGLNHFPVDIEASVERCHRNICAGGSAIFQAGGLVVLLVEVHRKSYLASLVPVILNAVLNEHQLVIDIVAFVAKGDFPRSRLHEKQRGKILASWVTKRLRTIAQFGIRDASVGGVDLVVGGAAEGGNVLVSVGGGGQSPGLSPQMVGLGGGDGHGHRRSVSSASYGGIGGTPYSTNPTLTLNTTTSSPSPGPAGLQAHTYTSELPAFPETPYTPTAPQNQQNQQGQQGPQLTYSKSISTHPHALELPTSYNTTPPALSHTTSNSSSSNPGLRIHSASPPLPASGQPGIPPPPKSERRYSSKGKRDSALLAMDYAAELPVLTADEEGLGLDEWEKSGGGIGVADGGGGAGERR